MERAARGDRRAVGRLERRALPHPLRQKPTRRTTRSARRRFFPRLRRGASRSRTPSPSLAAPRLPRARRRDPQTLPLQALRAGSARGRRTPARRLPSAPNPPPRRRRRRLLPRPPRRGSPRRASPPGNIPRRPRRRTPRRTARGGPRAPSRRPRRSTRTRSRPRRPARPSPRAAPPNPRARVRRRRAAPPQPRSTTRPSRRAARSARCCNPGRRHHVAVPVRGRVRRGRRAPGIPGSRDRRGRRIGERRYVPAQLGRGVGRVLRPIGVVRRARRRRGGRVLRLALRPGIRGRRRRHGYRRARRRLERHARRADRAPRNARTRRGQTLST